MIRASPCTPEGYYTALRPLCDWRGEIRIGAHEHVDAKIESDVQLRVALAHVRRVADRQGRGLRKLRAPELVDKPPPPDIPTGPSPHARRRLRIATASPGTAMRLLRGYYEATTRLLATRLLPGYYQATTRSRARATRPSSTAAAAQLVRRLLSYLSLILSYIEATLR
jgi:hypothetical protein